MKTIIVAAVIAFAAGILYQTMVDNDLGVKETTSLVTNTVGKVVKEVSNELNENNVVEKSAEHLSTIKDGAMDFLNNSQFQAQLMDTAKNITLDEKKYICDNHDELLQKYRNGEDATSVQEQVLFTYLKQMESSSVNNISPEIYEAAITLFCK